MVTAQVPPSGRAHDAIQAMWASLDRGDHEGALAIATAQAELFVEWGFDLPLDRLEAMLERLEVHAPDDPWLLYYRAWAWSTQRRHTLGLVTLKRAEHQFDARLERGTAEWRRARFLVRMAEGTIAEREGLYELARIALAEAAALSGSARLPTWSDDETRWVEHDPSGFIAFTLQAFAIYRQEGLTQSTARAAHNLGTRLLDRGELAPALRFLEKAHELKAPASSRASLANTLNSLGQAERHLGLLDRAFAHLTEAREMAREAGHEWLESYALNNLAELERDREDWDRAVALYGESLRIKERTDNAFGQAHTHVSIADLHLLRRDPREAIAAADLAVAMRVPSDDALETARLLACRARARISAAEGVESAVEDLEPIVAQLRELDAKGELAVSCWWLAAGRRLLADEPGVQQAVAEAIGLATRHRLGHLLAPHLAATPQLADEALQAARAIPVPMGHAPASSDEARQTTQVATMPRLTAHLFGELQVELDSTPVPLWSWRSKRAVSLLAILLLRRGQPVHRDEAIEWLWPETEPDRAGKHLNVALSAVRRGLSEAVPNGAACVQRLGATYRIRPDALSEIDVVAFELMATTADGHASRRELREAKASAVTALALVGGDLLASEPYAEWAEPERLRLRDRAIELRTSLAEWHLALGEPRDAIREAGLVLAAERWRERAWRVQIEAHRALGDRSAALQSLDACGLALQEELGVQLPPVLRTMAAELRT